MEVQLFRAKTILFVCFDLGWNSKIRTLIGDMQMAKEAGDKVIFLTHQSATYLEMTKAIVDKQIEVVPSHFLNRFIEFYRFYSLKKILIQEKVDIVHSFNIEYIIHFGMQLRKFPLKALVFSVDNVIAKPMRSFVHRIYTSRLDSLILLNKYIKFEVLNKVYLAQKKIDYFGKGFAPLANLNQSNIFHLYHNFYLCGASAESAVQDLDNLRSSLIAIKLLNDFPPHQKQSKLILFYRFEATRLIVMEKIKQFKVEDDVILVEEDEFSSHVHELHLWLTLTSHDLIEDFALMALTKDIPTIFIRNFTTLQFMADYPGLGETYKAQDARELREKWEAILLAHNYYVEKTRVYRFFLERECSTKNYRLELQELYRRTFSRRLKFFTKINT